MRRPFCLCLHLRHDGAEDREKRPGDDGTDGWGAVAAAVLFGWTTPFLFWIGPQLLGQPPLRAYLLAEHTGCTQDGNGLTNTRTALTSAPVRLLMWDTPYHAEHYLFPSIQFRRLADAHTAIRENLGCVQAGYTRWHIGFIRSLAVRGTAYPKNRSNQASNSAGDSSAM